MRAQARGRPRSSLLAGQRQGPGGGGGRGAARADGKVQDPGGGPGGIEADDEEGVVVVEWEEGVERHHEASLGLARPPVACDPLELLAQTRVDLARVERAR